ncbi:MAG: TRAP transporter substrate-binding protein [candidate division NC10 bacterium]|nr:TRAP transporter substrate-binding protein [candidate division NC10 bacterium]
MRKIGVIILVMIGVLMSAAGGEQAWAQQKPIEIRFGHVGFPNSLFDITVNEYAKRVNAALKGRVDVKVFHSSQLGTDEAMVKGIKVGALEMFLPSTIMSTVDPKFGVFEMPYIIVNRAHMRRVAGDARVKGALFEPLPPKGMRILAIWENGFRHVTNNVRPIVTPEDLKGIKLRIPGGVWRGKMFRAYGASPSPMPFAEVYAALQSGVMDGQENPFPQIAGAKFHEVQKYLSLTGHVYTPAYPVISEAFWQKLPRDVQQTLEKIAVEVGDFARSEGERLDKDLVATLTAGQMKMNEVDKETFIRASAPIYHEFAVELKGGGDLIRLIQSLR